VSQTESDEEEEEEEEEEEKAVVAHVGTGKKAGPLYKLNAVDP
jgi:hypothetical protein